jgi:hypothetical protein
MSRDDLAGPTMNHPSYFHGARFAQSVRSRGLRLALTFAASCAGLAAALGTSAPLTGCGETNGCQRLRNDTYNSKLIWGACDPSEPAPCILVGGNTGDCTGVLSCNFAVNRNYRETAERAVLSIAAQSLGCYVCATPNCPQGNTAWCEPVTRECIIVDVVVDAGSVISTTTTTTDASEPVDVIAPVVDASSSDATAGD